MYELKYSEELYVTTMKNNAKFKEELTCCFKVDTTIWQILTRAIQCLKSCTLTRSFWSKYIKFELKNHRKCDVWWHWGLMQNLKENWLVLSNMTWGIQQIFTGWKK